MKTWPGLALLLCGLLTACGGSTLDPPATEPSSAATPAPPTPTPTPTTPSEAEDAANLQQARLTAADLGKPWLQDVKPKASDPKAKRDGPTTQEFCPGHITETGKTNPVATLYQSFKNGKAAGASNATFYLFTLGEEERSVLQTGFENDIKACAAYKDQGGSYYFTNTPEGPDSILGADEVVISYTERIYTDKAHQNLVYTRHNVVTRAGRAYSSVSYGFQASKKDPGGKDFAAATRLAQLQTAKTAKAFSA